MWLNLKVPPLVPRSATGSRLHRHATLPPGSDWCRGSIRPAATTDSAVSPSKEIGGHGGCWLSARWPSSATHRKHETKNRPLLGRVIERRPTKVAAVALASKIARKARAIVVRGEKYKVPKLLLTALGTPADRSATPSVCIDLLGWSPKYFPQELVRHANGQLTHEMS